MRDCPASTSVAAIASPVNTVVTPEFSFTVVVAKEAGMTILRVGYNEASVGDAERQAFSLVLPDDLPLPLNGVATSNVDVPPYHAHLVSNANTYPERMK